MAALTRNHILTVTDLPKEEVQVPEWGGSVYVRGFTGAERAEFEQTALRLKNGEAKALKDFRALAVSWTVVDENGARLFEPKDVPELNNKSARVLDRLFEVAKRLSGLDEEGRERSRKKSASDQSTDSGTS